MIAIVMIVTVAIMILVITMMVVVVTPGAPGVGVGAVRIKLINIDIRSGAWQGIHRDYGVNGWKSNTRLSAPPPTLFTTPLTVPIMSMSMSMSVAVTATATATVTVTSAPAMSHVQLTRNLLRRLTQRGGERWIHRTGQRLQVA